MQSHTHEVCQKYLDELAEAVPEITTAVVTTSDGFEVAVLERGALSHAKLAAMTSSMHALGDALVGESTLTNCRNVIVEAETGHILMLAVQDVEEGLLLSVIADHQVTIGKLLWASKHCCKHISDGLGRVRPAINS